MHQIGCQIKDMYLQRTLYRLFTWRSTGIFMWMVCARLQTAGQKV
jgi:hypothetical protein